MNPKLQLIEDIASFRHDPYGFALYAFPWGEGELKNHSGPRVWQKELLETLGEKLRAGEMTSQEALQFAISSGHGIGKSALVSILILWALSTMEDSRVLVTANTESQLATKTWPELGKWHRLAINSDWFKYTATSLFSLDAGHEKTWRADMVSWSENNTEAFAGLHNEGRRILVIFDEASAISDKVWEVTEGALTDENTEIIWCAFGNPTRNTGRFRECFGRLKHRWFGRQIDSRNVEGTNKAQIQKWVDDYGEDSDFVRVRVRGLFPNASSLQFIPSDLVAEAMRRPPMALPSDPLIMALDVARGGDDNCVFSFRRGMDARSIPSVVVPGSEVHDSNRLLSIGTELIARYKPDAFFIDATGVGGPLADHFRKLNHRVRDIQFGAGAPDPHYANMRSYMWARLKEALRLGLAIENNAELEMDLTSPEFGHKQNRQDQLILEAKDHMKARGLASPDRGDALAMTFAYHVAPTQGPSARHEGLRFDYDPFQERGH